MTNAHYEKMRSIVDRKEYWAERIAVDLRNYLDEKQILSANDYQISEEALEKIVTHFKGSLVELTDTDDTRKSYIKKTGQDTFEIHYRDRSDYMTAFHELGHAFLDLDEMNDGEEIACDGLRLSDRAAWLFARTLAMPRDGFETLAVEKNYNIRDIADVYRLNYYPVLLRGKDLNIWK